MMKLQARQHLMARPEVERVMEESVIRIANERIARLARPCAALGISQEMLTTYFGEYLHEEVLPGIEHGAYDAHKAAEVINSITALQIAHHFLISGSKHSPAEIHQHGKLMADDPEFKKKILAKMGLTPHEFHALSLMILQEAKETMR